MRVVVMVNGGAGSVGEDEEQQLREIEEAFAAAGAEADARSVPADEFADQMRATWDGPDRPDAIVVAGGDGTVNLAAGVAAGTDLVLGVLPLGTFNHFAKDLGLPTDLSAAAAALTASEVISVDVAEVNGQVYVNNSALGIYPTMVALRDELREDRGWGKIRAVPVASAKVLRRLPIHRLDLVGPDFERRRVRTPFVFIGNGVFDNDTGGAMSRADLTDGLLGVSVARVVSRWGLIRTAVAALLAGASQSRELDQAEVPELTITGRTRRLRVGYDGEIAWFDLPLRYRCRPGDLRVLAPRGEDTPAV